MRLLFLYSMVRWNYLSICLGYLAVSIALESFGFLVIQEFDPSLDAFDDHVASSMPKALSSDFSRHLTPAFTSVFVCTL